MESGEFQGRIGRTWSESEPWWPGHPRPAAGTPNVVLVVLDDVSFTRPSVAEQIVKVTGEALATQAVGALVEPTGPDPIPLRVHLPSRRRAPARVPRARARRPLAVGDPVGLSGPELDNGGPAGAGR